MHSLVLMTALSATTGLFGGGHGKAKHCGRPAAGVQAVSAPVSSCQSQASCGTSPMPQYAPPAMMAPAPQPMAAPQPIYPGHLSYYAAPTHTCAGGSCARR